MRKFLVLLVLLSVVAFGVSSASASIPKPGGWSWGGDGGSVGDAPDYGSWTPGDGAGDLICGENPLGGVECPGDDEGIEGMPGALGPGDAMPGPMLCGPYIIFAVSCPEERTLSVAEPDYAPNPAYTTGDDSQPEQAAEDAASEAATVDWVAPPANPCDMFALGDAG